MATTFPSGINPFVFSDSVSLILPVTQTEIDTDLKAQLDLHPAAYTIEDFTAAVSNANTCVLNFVIFDYPNANNGGGTPPAAPIVEILDQFANFDAPGHLLSLTGGGTGALTISTLSGSMTVNYSYASLGGGVYQIVFTRDAVDLTAVPWSIRFTINDGATNVNAEKGLTFSVDATDTRTSWIAVPGQASLTPAGAPAFDYGAALQALTLSGPGMPGSARQIIAGRNLSLQIPIGNYGPGSLSVTAVNPAAQTNLFTAALAATPLTVAPGSSDKLTLSIAFAAPPAGQTGSAAQATAFTLGCNDPEAAPSGATAHPNTVSVFATAGNFEIVFALDLSGSMAATDAGGQSRWAAVQSAVGQVMTQMIGFATASGDKFGVAGYPNANGNSVGQIVQAETAISQANANTLLATLGGFAPTDSTPMAGVSATKNSGGIYTAAGLIANPATDCGIFLGSVDPGFARNFRWLILMSDGMSNVGDDPKTIPSTYFTNRRIGVISVAFGNPAGGQVDIPTLKAVANASLGTNSANPPNFYAAQPNGTPSQQLLATFEKSVATALGLQFAADPDAVIAPNVKQNHHTAIITNHDETASFMACCTTAAQAETMQIGLLSPLGEQITSQNAATFGITYALTRLSKSFSVSGAALVNAKASPRYGTWTLIVSRGPIESTPPAGTTPAGNIPTAVGIPPLPYAYSISMRSDLTLAVGSGHSPTVAGDAIQMIAALSLHGRPLNNAHVTAVMAGSGQGFDNWLASQTITQAEYDAALRSLVGLHDVQALFVKVTALAAKNIFFPGTGGGAVQTLRFDNVTGTWRTTFPAITVPGTYQFLVSASGQDDSGNGFTRQQNWQTAVVPLPDAASTLISITYQLVAGHMQATLRFSPADRFGNVLPTDPTVNKAVQVILSGGAVAVGPLRWNLDASYTQIFTYPPTATPGINIIAGGGTVGTITPPDFNKMQFVNQAIRYTKGREATPGANKDTDPTKALGNPSTKPLTSFVALGGMGSGAFAIQGQVIQAKQVMVFVAIDTSLRAYAVDVLPARAGAGWVEVGRSRGVTQSFNLVPLPRVPPNTKGWYIDVNGSLADETFDVKIPLGGLLKPVPDPLTRIGSKGIAQVRIRDLSNVVSNPDGTPSASPGVSLLAIGFTD
jgi:hypothetical protein